MKLENIILRSLYDYLDLQTELEPFVAFHNKAYPNNKITTGILNTLGTKVIPFTLEDDNLECIYFAGNISTVSKSTTSAENTELFVIKYDRTKDHEKVLLKWMSGLDIYRQISESEYDYLINSNLNIVNGT